MKLHIYAQQLNHDAAMLVADKRALFELRDAIDRALREGNTCLEFEVADGEGYSLYIVELEEKDISWEQLDLPYVDRRSMGFKDQHAPSPPFQLIGADRHKELRAKLRKNAWDTVKNMPEQKMAYQYSKLFNRLVYGEELVSAIIPSTIDRIDQVEQILKALNEQTYKAIEAVVVWDEVTLTEEQYEKTRKITDNLRFTVKHMLTYKEGYNLAMARNLGVIEAEGKYLLFNDSRLCPEPEAVQMFTLTMNVPTDQMVWFFGEKGSNKSSFVENFSFVNRLDFIKFGMMNERISKYGGMSQEIRTRWVKQGGSFQYVPSALASELRKSGMSDQKRQDIIEMKMQLLKMYGGDNH